MDEHLEVWQTDKPRAKETHTRSTPKKHTFPFFPAGISNDVQEWEGPLEIICHMISWQQLNFPNSEFMIMLSCTYYSR